MLRLKWTCSPQVLIKIHWINCRVKIKIWQGKNVVLLREPKYFKLTIIQVMKSVIIELLCDVYLLKKTLKRIETFNIMNKEDIIKILD